MNEQLRKAKLEKALAVPENLYNYPWQDAAEWENKRLAPLHEALVKAVEALEIIRESLTTEREQRAVVIEKRTREALSKIDKALGAE